MKGGIHPDTIKSATVDLHIEDYTTKTFINAILVNKPIHIISATAAYVAISHDTTAGNEHKQVKTRSPSTTAIEWAMTPASFSLFTLPAFVTDDLDMGGWDPEQGGDYIDGRDYIVSGAVNPYTPHWRMPEDLWGYFCDGALFVEMNAAYQFTCLRVTVNYVDRAQFSPAYPDPVGVMQHYWKCAHGDKVEFLEGFYGGSSFDVDSSAVVSVGSSLPGSSRQTNPGSWITTAHSAHTW